MASKSVSANPPGNIFYSFRNSIPRRRIHRDVIQQLVGEIIAVLAGDEDIVRRAAYSIIVVEWVDREINLVDRTSLTQTVNGSRRAERQSPRYSVRFHT
jgi:hypothetical protein